MVIGNGDEDTRKQANGLCFRSIHNVRSNKFMYHFWQ